MNPRIWMVGTLAFGGVAAAVAAASLDTFACAASSAGREPAAAAAAPVAVSDPSLPAERPAAAPGPRVVMIGFDGASYDLAKQFIAEGKMPWCRKLAEAGAFLPLGSSNPAESPVAWASINTGMNPGKTNIFGFIRRTFRYIERPAEKPGAPGTTLQLIIPTIGYSRDASQPFAEGLEMPATVNDLRCRNFWDWLDDAGLPSRILQAACNYPATAGEHTRLLAGLSVPDVRGGPGTYLIFTNSEWEFDRATNTGGEVKKFKVICPTCRNKSFNFTKGCSKCADGKKVGLFETRLKGPENFVERQQWDRQVAALEKQLKDAADGTPEKQHLQRELNVAKNQRRDWEKERGHATVPLKGWVDKAAGTIRFELAGREFTVKEGGWSEYVPITFEIEGAFPVKATAHLHVSQCNATPESETGGDVRFYLPAITAAADGAPRNMPITSPPEFGRELVADAGHFDTIGWSCQTHALKDDELSDQSFMTAIWDTIQWRRRMLEAQLEKPDWRTLFQVFGETDRVCHMMYRYFDEKHPQYKAADAREKTVRFGEREIPLEEAIPAVYEEVDRTIGLVMERIERGELGDCTLMVCSDHGFSPFREEVELNAWLIDQGFMALQTDRGGAPTTKNLQYVDWSRTRAYSNGIGTIYLNLKGREPDGIVDPADYDKVCGELIAKMSVYRNPNSGSANDPRVFAGAWKRSQYLAGPFAADIRDEKGRCVEGAADIQVGFNYGYRVAWGTALGDRAKDSPVFPNKSKWSGDHTSVHPYLVRGIFLSNRKAADGTLPHLQDLAPTILAIHGLPVPADVDGRVIPLAGLEEAARKHAGGTANREALVAPAD